MRPFLPIATLLGAAFLLGCQEQGPGPVGPEGPQFDQPGSVCPGHCHGDDADEATFTVTHDGDVTTVPSPVEGRGGQQGNAITLGGHANTDEIAFSDVFANLLGDGGENCFGRAGGNTISREFSGALRRDKKNPLKVTAQYFFRAFGTDGATEFKYQILLTGLVTSTIPAAGVTFPPDPGETVVVTWDAADVNVEGFGKGKKGGNLGSACVKDDVAVNGGVTLLGDAI